MAGFQLVLRTLEWRGHKFCTHPTFMEITDAMLGDRGIVGWASVWGCEVHMNFPLSLLRED
jgi:hypothetical protein